MDILCNFNTIVSSIDCSHSYNHHTGVFKLIECTEEILFTNEKREKVSLKENEIILARCLIDSSFFQELSVVQICSKHRALLGKEWYQQKKCCNSNHDKAEVLNSNKLWINLIKAQSLTTLLKFKLIDDSYQSYGFGSLICKKHNDELTKLLDEAFKKYEFILTYIKRIGRLF